MSRKSSLTPEQLAEMLKLSATKNVSELAEIFKRNRATIHYHFKRAKIIIFKKGVRGKNKKIKFKPKQFKREEKINAGKNYIDYLKIENERRKNKGLYLFKQGK